MQVYQTDFLNYTLLQFYTVETFDLSKQIQNEPMENDQKLCYSRLPSLNFVRMLKKFVK